MKSAVIAGFMAFACAFAPGGADAQDFDLVEAYSAPPSAQAVQISPGGSRLLMTAGSVDDGAVIITSLDGGERYAVSLDGEPYYAIEWLNDDYFMITYSQRRAVNYGSDTADVGRQLVVRYDGGHNYEVSEYMLNIQAIAPHDPEHVYMRGLFLRDDRSSMVANLSAEDAIGFAIGLFKVEIATGRTHLVARGAQDTRSFFLDEMARPVVESNFDDEDNQIEIRYRQPGERRWRFAYRERLERVFRSRYLSEYLGVLPSPMGIDSTGRYLYFNYRGTSGRREVSRFDLYEQEIVGPVYASPISDVSGAIVDDNTNAVVGIIWYEGDRVVEWIDPEFALVHGQIQGAFPDSVVRMVSYDRDFNRIVVQREGGGSSGAYYLLDRSEGTLRLITRTRNGIPDASVNPVEVIHYAARDGLDIMAYLTLPQGRGRTNLPLVVMPHGGPESRDRPGFDDWAQMLATQGYAVVQPQFRGSDGFGYDFVVRGHGQWGRAMQDDLTDAVSHLADAGIVDPDRVCIFGWSYGGYAALAGAAFTPEVYRCVIAGAGIADTYQMMLEEREQFNASSIGYWTTVLGADYRTNRDALHEISPARHVDANTPPVMIIHGDAELVVNYAQAETMAAALDEVGVAHELITIEGGVHHSYRMTTEQKRIMYSNLLRWLQRYNPAD